MMKVMAVIGTRPEVIKMAPVVRRLEEDGRFSVRVCVTAQHRELLDSMMRVFKLKAHVDLDLMKRDQTPSALLSRMITGMDDVLRDETPDLVIAQGDTMTVLGSALASFHRKIAFGHMEAGLRSFDKWNPFPEEENRVLVDHLSDILFAPTPAAADNLAREGIDPANVFVTGNTAIDALFWALERRRPFAAAELRRLEAGARVVVVTLHRRESFGAPMERIFRGILEAAELIPELTWVYPVHPNPQVRALARRLLRHRRILLVPPLDYLDFVALMKRSEFIVTDSGGIQEEAPSLGKPVLVMREKTERPEVLEAEGVLVGTAKDRFMREVRRLAGRGGRGPRPRRNPFGDGRAAQRIVAAVASWAGRRRHARRH